MRPDSAAIHLASAIQAASRAESWEGPAADRLADWCEARQKKLASERGARSLAALCGRIRQEASRVEAVSVDYLSRLEDVLQSSTFLCDPDEPGG